MNRIAEIKERYGEQNLIEMVHTFLVHQKLDQQAKRFFDGRIGKFYPSSVGRCRRQIAYQMMGMQGKSPSGQNLLVLENGTSFHDRMEKIFEDMGIMIAPELVLKDKELRISGRSDAIIWNFLKEEDEPEGEIIKLHRQKVVDGVKQYDENGAPIPEVIYEGPQNDVLIVEFKSIKTKGYERLMKTKPKAEHEMQLQLYFYLTGIRKGLVYYEKKDNQEQKYYVVDYNQKIIDRVIGDIKYVIEHLDNDQIPEREYQPTDFPCRYCDFRDICYQQENPVDYETII